MHPSGTKTALGTAGGPETPVTSQPQYPRMGGIAVEGREVGAWSLACLEVGFGEGEKCDCHGTVWAGRDL